MGGSSAPANTSTKTELPSWLAPYAQSYIARAGQLSDMPMPVYGGQRSADMNGYQTAGNNIVAQRALGGSSEIAAGSNTLQNTLNGAYLGQGNPYLSNVIDRASQDVTRNYQGAVGSTDATFARQGAFGGSAWQNAQEGNARQLAQGLGDVAGQMRYQDYTNERSNQMQAMPLALNYGNQAYTDAAQLAQVGATQYGFDQQRIDDQIGYWQDVTQSPYKQLDVLGNAVKGAMGGGGTVTQIGTAGRANPFAQAAGAGAALYGLMG